MNNLNDLAQLIQRLERNYLCLHRHYRLGGFERPVGYLHKWRPDEARTNVEFYELCDQEIAKHDEAKAGDISFQAAINDLYQLVLYIESEQQETAVIEGVLLLRCKCLIYEATDYLLDVPAALGSYFIDIAENFPHRTRDVERQAEDLNGGIFTNKDERERLNRFVIEELPSQHEEERQSFGLLGLAQYEKVLQF